MNFTLKNTRLALRNSKTRIPFRYGTACLTSCPQAILSVDIEANGKSQRGFAGDCLPPSWFDKSPGKTYGQQIDDMLAAIGLAEKALLEEAHKPIDCFSAWLTAYQQVHRHGAKAGFPTLLTSFGLSMVERAVMDALARAAQVSFADAVRQNLYCIEPGLVHPELEGLQPRDWLSPSPKTSLHVRHTIGLSDPLSWADVSDEQRVNDGFPETLEQYVQQTGIRYFKAKVSNQLEHDCDRLQAIASIVERTLGTEYHVTLDGNELYSAPEQFAVLIDALRSTPQLRTLWENTLLIEQPLERTVSLDPKISQGIDRLAGDKPVIIDEADGTLQSYPESIALGYRGVSSKACKGPIKSLLNAGLTWVRNDRGSRRDYVMSGEDLCSVGIVPVQSDLCLVATLGLTHVERNGHHYHPGLTYLPATQQEAAVIAHPDLYARQHGRIAPTLHNGCFELSSLQCIGFGFAVEPDLDSMSPAADWQFALLT